MLIIMCIICILLLLQKNMSMMMVVMMIGFVMLFLGGADMRHLVGLCLLAVPVVLLRHDTVAAMPFLAMMAPVGLIVPSVMLPTTYKLGATKGRVVYIVMLMVVAGVCVLLVNLSKESGAPATLSPLATTAISLAVFIGSWALSVKWFKAREL